jgi:hypothetical protein
MSKITKIYLDLDGVIADFNKKYKEMFDVYPKKAEKDKNFDKFFTEFIDKQAFVTLDLMPNAINLVSYLRQTGIPVEILSSTASERRDSQIRPQKMKWLSDHQIEFPAILVPGAYLKKEFALPTAILIDDTEKNIIQWQEAGGIGILYKDYDSCVAILQEYI